MKKAEVQMTFFKAVKKNVSDAIVELLEKEGTLKRVDEFLCTPDYEVKKDKVYDKVSTILLTTFEKAKYDFTWYSEIDFGEIPREIADDILNILIEEEQVVKVADDMYTLKKNMDEARIKILDKLKDDPLITIAQVRDLFDTSRKSAKPILEYMDSIKVTKKNGAESERVAYK
jgi:selenocysteine-specific elongation factor